MSERRARVHRTTSETDVDVEVCLDGEGKADVQTGVGFVDHMLDALARHGRLDLRLRCTGDLHVDDHHTVEDCGLALGAAIDEALGDRRGVARFGHAYAPLDEALARAVVDLSGRPFARVALGLRRERLGEASTEALAHLLASLATAMRAALHVDVLEGDNDHHRCEAAYKATALALRQAIRREGPDAVPSTKGVL